MTNVLIAPNLNLKSLLPDPQTILIFAIEELDVLISELICTGSMSISPNFHDWVADTLTRTIEARLLEAQQTRQFKNSLRLGDFRTVLAHWVRHWTCVEIKQKFGQYAKFCPCAKPSALLHSG